MKFLCLSDLHYTYTWDQFGYVDLLKNLIEKENPDYILIAGDIVESSIIKHANIYKVIRENIFRGFDMPIIFCLGNHEFANNSSENVFKRLNYYKNNNFNCYCLDTCNYFDIPNTDYRVIGNVLWYDNSLKSNINSIDDVIDNSWLDSSINKFIPSIECNKCKKQILNNIKKNKKHILLTHCVPHKGLNWFTENMPNSIYNQYSGCADFLNELKDKNIEWSFCGHTHKRMMEVYHNIINCVNIGNDYIFKTNEFKYFSFEI